MVYSRRLAQARFALVLALGGILTLGDIVVLHPTSPWLWLPAAGMWQSRWAGLYLLSNILPL